MSQRIQLTQSHHPHPATVPAKKFVRKESRQSESRRLSFRLKASQSPEFQSKEKLRRKIDFTINRATYLTTFISATSTVRASVIIFELIVNQTFILSSIARASHAMGFRC